MRWSILLFVTTVFAAACSTLPGGLPQAPLEDLPWSASAPDQAVLQARAKFDRGEHRQALDQLQGVLAEQANHMDALRLRQDILRERGRRGLLLYEVQQMLAADAEDPVAHYLAGRLRREDRDRQQHFAAAVQAAPRSLWPWFGLAHSLRDADVARSLAIYGALYLAADKHPLVGVSYAAVLLRAKQVEAAAAVYRDLQADERVPGVGDLGLAQTMLALERREDAWTALMAALRTRPYDPGVHALLHAWLETGATVEQERQVLDILREDPARLAGFTGEAGTQLLVDMLVRGMQPQAALLLLEQAPGSAHRPAWRRLQRRLLLALGEVEPFLRMVREDVPEWLVAAEGNRLRGRWLELLHGPWSAPGVAQDMEGLLGLGKALLAVGWLVEVELLGDFAARRGGDAAAPLLALRDEARRELAFEAGLRRLLYQGYRNDDSASLEAVVERVRALSLRTLGQDVVGKPTVFSLPMIGELVDPFSGDLADHFDRYNRHFVLGRRSGGVAEGMLFVRLSLADLPDSQLLALPGRCLEVIAIDRDVRALGGVLGGDLAGVALLNHFLVDFDAVRDWARSIAERRRVAREDGNALADDPLPDAVGDDPLDVAWRLSLMSSVQDSELDAAVLDTIRHHERQHLVDSFHYLPVEENFWRALGLVLGFGLSPAAIEAEMERRAELAALVVSEHTELVLAHIADFLGEPGLDSPHHQGFGDLARQLCEALAELGVPAQDCVPSRWHLVPREQVRRAASKLLAHLRGD